MTDLSTLKVETQALVARGRESAEDALTLFAASGFVHDAVSVPYGVFGSFPDFSPRYAEIWDTLVRSRGTEFLNACEELWKQGAGLVRIAADYEETDIEAAYSFDVGFEDVAAYLSANVGSYSVPGSGLSGDFHRDNPGATATKPSEPGASTLLGRVDAEKPPTAAVGPVVATWIPLVTKFRAPGSNPGHYTYSRSLTLDPGDEAGKDQLHDLVTQHMDVLTAADAFFEAVAVTDTKPLSEMILHAYRTAPTILESRGTALSQLAVDLGVMAEEMRAETFELQASWWGTSGSSSDQDVGTGASAIYYIAADTCMRYLAQIRDIVFWQSKHAVELARILRDIRVGYCNAILERIQDLIDATAEYASAAPDAFCDPEETYAEAISSFVEGLRQHTSGNISLMLTYLEIDKFRLDAESAFAADLFRFTEPLSYPQVAGGDSWIAPGSWKPKDDHPSAFIDQEN